MRLVLPFLASILALTACSTPREACLRQATAELDTVRALIVQSEATLARGYAIQTEQRAVVYTDFCIGRGSRRADFRFCNRVAPVTSKRAVAIDPQAEERKLASLKSRESVLIKRSANQLRQCDLTHPAQAPKD